MDVRAWLEEKRGDGVKQVRVASVLERLDQEQAAAAAAASRRNGGKKPTEAQARYVIEHLDEYLKRTHWTGPDVLVVGHLVGTREVADVLLGVERPRIGRYMRGGKMPAPVANLASGPVWLTSQIVTMREYVESSRRRGGEESRVSETETETPQPGQEPGTSQEEEQGGDAGQQGGEGEGAEGGDSENDTGVDASE